MQVAFVQNAGRIAQTATLAAGQYAVSFRAAQRGNVQLGTQVIAVVVDGVTVGQFQPPGTDYALYHTPAFALASSGLHTVELVGVGGGGSDFSAFVDDVQIGAPVSTPLANLGFETPSLAGGYQYAPSGATWTFSAGAGITGNGNAFTSGNPVAPEGTQVGFIQGNYGMVQSATFAPGQYVVSFQAAQRGNYQQGTQVVDVRIDGTSVGQCEPAGASYALCQTPPFTIAVGGDHTLALVGIGAGGADFTAFVDDVKVTAQ